MVLEISGWRRHRQRWRTRLTRKRAKEGPRHRRGPFFLSGVDVSTRNCPASTHRLSGRLDAPRQAPLPTEKIRSGRVSVASPRKAAKCLARARPSVHRQRRDESNYRRVESSTCHLPSCIVAPTWHYRWWVNHGGTPINCIRLQVADFRRPSHMDPEKPLLRPKKVPRGRV